MSENHQGGDGPLTGITVVDLSRALAGPHAAMLLGDLGARVIKVENPGSGGDDTRQWGPPFVDSPAGRQSTYFLSCNRNKESIALDLKSEEDMAVLRALIARADVLIENFRNGVMDRLGLSTGELLELNPRLIVLSITGFGHDGPEAHRAGYDQIMQGEAGLLSLTGSGPEDLQRVGVPIADLLAGIHGAWGVTAALFERTGTGRGQVVRTSLLSGIVSTHTFQGTRFTVGHEIPHADGNHHPSIAPYGLFRSQDGVVQLSVGSPRQWEAFCQAFGLDPDRPGFSDNPSRVEHRAELIETLEAIFSDVTTAELLERLDAAGIPAGKVRTLDEVYAWEQVRSQGLLVKTEHAALGRIRIPGSPLRFFSMSERGEEETTRTGHTAPPLLDQDGIAIRDWLKAGESR